MPDNLGSTRIVSLLVSLILVSLPFFAVHFAPITDLPQQASQIRLLLDAIADQDAGMYRVQWFKPGNLSYLVLGLCWLLFDPVTAGRMAMMIISVFWVFSIQFLAWRRSRPPETAMLATLFVFNESLYWGFYSFMIGAPAFLLWFHETTRPHPQELTARDALITFFYGLLLYSCHILWLLCGLVWLLFHSLLSRNSVRSHLSRIMCLSPVILLAVYWYLDFSGTRMAEQSALWVEPSKGTLLLVWLVESAFGGIKGPVEYCLFLAVSIWAVVAIATNRKELRAGMDWELFAAGALFVFGSFLLPDIFMTTVLFNARWIPIGLLLLALSLPAIPVRLRLRQTAAAALLAGLSAVTILSWMDFEKKETSGLVEALAALPKSARVVGLDTIQSSHMIKGQPSLHMFAYAQALKGCTLNFSFADFSSSLVTYRDKTKKPWTEHVEWFPERLTLADLQYFDYAIVNGFEDIHERIGSKPYFEPVTTDGRWRLYKIVHENVPGGGNLDKEPTHDNGKPGDAR
uniref:Glycosyltransferase RgtA/B/C/D-like domain-containing protein n=1 Tax=Desulfomonile tiedjei TaxID=2358 RepID=A0A7C4EW18_9BACT